MVRNIHWDYYIALEQDLENLSRYIEFEESNFSTYSIELTRLLIAIGSEVDVVAKELCCLLASKSKCGNINQYRKQLEIHIPDISSINVFSEKYRLNFIPWSSWKEGDDVNPSWWKSHNDVKHGRGEYYKKANLKNVLEAMSGLLIVNIYYNHYKLSKAVPYFLNSLGHSMRSLKPTHHLLRIDDPLLYFVYEGE